MKRTYDLSALDWTVEGYTPYLWKFEREFGTGFGSDRQCIDVRAVPARVPGSVQGALREAGILPDWNIATHYRACEWVENRHWIYRATLPDDRCAGEAAFRLECLGLDYTGWVYLNGREVGAFKGTHIPHAFDLTGLFQPNGNVLEIVFDLPPRWLGQFGYTSQMREWKPRFNFTWDWTPRLLQVGIWDDISLVAVEGSAFGAIRCFADADPASGTGILDFSGQVTPGSADRVEVTLSHAGEVLRTETLDAAAFANGTIWTGLDVALWWPNLEGEQPLYNLSFRLLDTQGVEQERAFRRVGFKHVDWLPCEGAPSEADPWQCVINGRPVFLQGVNFAPLCANYADLTRDDYAKKLEVYHQLGLNLFRINACQFLERQWFYDLCDELGLLVWQEYPLTSSGLENWAPEDPASIEAVAEIAASFVRRRGHHASLLLWSGGNELQGDLQGRKTGVGLPCPPDHPMLARLREVTQALDPYHRYIHTSPAGPRAGASPEDFGKGLHWDVHGGAAMLADIEEARRYWAADDALFRSEIYCPGASPAALIQKYAGEMEVYPPSTANPYWTRLTTWWNDWNKMIALHGREPEDLEEYIAWSQAYQATMLAAEMRACKQRFPRCGGVLLWSGHDTFPLTINSSLIDFDGGLKPSAQAVSEVWHCPPGQDGGQA